MTANTKTLEAIRLLRDEASGAHNRDWETMCGALADALEESLQPPAEKRGEAPSADDGFDPLHPAGRCVCGGEGRCRWCQRHEPVTEHDGEKCIADLRRALGSGAAFYPHRYSGNARLDAQGLLTAERRTHSPPPSREGEALLDVFADIGDELAKERGIDADAALKQIRGEVPEPSDQYALPPYALAGVECILYRQTKTYAQPASAGDLAAVLKAMPEERRARLVAPYVGLRENYIARANVLRERAEALSNALEASEGRVRKLEGLHFRRPEPGGGK